MTTTLDRKVAVTKALADRQRLLQLGYTPLPSRGKLCLLKGWPNVQPDDAMLKTWSRNLDLCSSGIRLEGQQIAIDLDALDEALVDAILDKLFDHWPRMNDAPERIGRAPKVLYLAQLEPGEAPLTHMSTKKWLSPAGEMEHVEVFGGGRKRFIGWYGPHTIEDTIGPDGWIVHRSYDDAGTLIPAAELPLITMATLRAWLADVDAIFAAHGYTEQRSEAGASSPFVRDLTDDMSFECDDGAIRHGLDAMAAYATDRDARCSISFLQPETHNTTRCRVSLSEGGELRVFDFGDWVTHAPVVDAVEPVPVDLSSLGAALASLNLGQGAGVSEVTEQGQTPGTPEIGVAERAFIDAGGDLEQWGTDEVQTAAERFEAAYLELMHGMVYDTTEAVCRYVDQSPEIGLTVSRRLDSYANHSMIVIGPKGGRKKINPLTAWAASRKRWEVAGVRFMPDAPIIFEEEGRQWLNLWREAEIDPELLDPEAVKTWFAFLAHLIPDEREREWFDRFVAHKMVNPRFRGAAVLMVAASVQGAGRSTLMATLYEVFGGYAASISSSHLFDSNQRNGWMERALWAFGNEVKFSTKYSDRIQAYERLKDLVDPAQSRVRLDEKYQRPREATIYTTFLLATNRPDALPISADDRRIMVITNGGKMPESMRQELYGQWYEMGRPTDTMVHSLRAYYRARGEAVVEAGETGDLVDAPKWASGREEMLEAGETDLDQVFASALGRIPENQIAMTREAFEKHLLGELTSTGLDHKRGAIRPFVTGLAGEVADRWGWAHAGRVRVGQGPEDRVRAVVRTRSGTEFSGMKPEERAKVLAGEEFGAVRKAR
jgi:hypothetical protein